MLLRRRLLAPLHGVASAAERGFTSVEQRIDAAALRRLARLRTDGHRAGFVELVVFGLKQAWACLFGALMLAAILASRLWYPDDAPLARNDALTLVAVAIQVLMLVTRLETVRELRVVLTFHVVGTVMELFKTDVGSWAYAADGVLRIGAVPLFSGFMYAAVGSYLVRVMRIFDLRFDRYPRRWVTALLAAAIYANFFTHHWVADARWVLVAAVLVVFGRSAMHFRVLHRVRRMPVVVAFVLVATFIWLAENLATRAGAWLYPAQADGWHPVSVQKLAAWFLLMIISVVLVTWVHPPRAPDAPWRAATSRVPRALVEARGTRDAAVSAAASSGGGDDHGDHGAEQHEQDPPDDERRRPAPAGPGVDRRPSRR
ncbi:DUF817 domain-containing protein [Cellulomonas sp.]|uniref:DUF817 domain-containing protein n=1 Tax=Cellulomonas sp. TaxID=40001 RepID=UPI00258507BD|nr:DUF817 domain-containing protein [Cellulomonas sp.]MCR6690325.1 DUF817 domain-containing protein [Cellulomonas sp.]